MPLGIILKNENKLEEMVSIMETLQKYVPSKKTTHSVPVPGTSDVEEVEQYHFHQILFGGDQLTAVRARSAQAIRANSENGIDRLEGLVPVAEDWHAKVCLLGVNTSFLPQRTVCIMFV